jgi:hypothetical protein
MVSEFLKIKYKGVKIIFEITKYFDKKQPLVGAS